MEWERIRKDFLDILEAPKELISEYHACGRCNHHPCGLCSCTAAVGQPYIHILQILPPSVETRKGDSQSEYDGKGR